MKKNKLISYKPCLVRKSLYIAIAAMSQFVVSAQVLAGPEGGQIVGGRGAIDQAGKNTTVNQHTERMAIDWQSFNLAADEKVQFIQPSSSSIALNRVLSHSGSEIHGQIEANGHIVLVNPNGVFFGENSHINVGGMVASGLHINPNDFMNGEFTLSALEGTEGKVVNSGIINAATGGSITLVGQQVNNEGLISARLGAVNLAAGKEAVVTFDARGLVGIKVTEGVLQEELGVDAAVINSGEINAEGGRILLSASASQDIFSQAVNHNGLNSSTSVVVHEDGSFTLGVGGDVLNTGHINVSSATGDAGQIILLGENITTSGNIRADAVTASAGHIELHSVDKTLVTESAQVSAQVTYNGVGGDIKILGNKIGLFDSAEVNASGVDGGGQVLIGGDESGNNTRIRNADFIYLGENTQVKADALLNGDGGKLITFASNTARIYGGLSTRGGSFDGDGGFIETSGLRGFELTSTPDISAAKGQGGTWLIDPYDITISTTDDGAISVGNENSNYLFESLPTASVVNINSLQTVLNTTGNGGKVIIRTAGDGTELGNITVDGNILYNLSLGNVATLRLEAANTIFFKDYSSITRAASGLGSLNVELIANLDGDVTNGGDIIFKQGSLIRTHGGYFSAGVRFDGYDADGNFIPRLEDIETPKGINFLTHVNNSPAFTVIDTSTGSNTSVPGGNVFINMAGDVIAGSRIKTGGGNFSVIHSERFTNNYTGSIDDYNGNDFANLQRALINIDGSDDQFPNNGGDPGFTSVFALIDTSDRVGGGDISIASASDVILGNLNFKYSDTSQNSSVVRVGSVSVASETGDIVLAQMLNFNDSGERNELGVPHVSIPDLRRESETTFLNLNAGADIHVNALIADMRWGDARDSLNISLVAEGDIYINADIYTAGGNFFASAESFDSAGVLINTDRANASQRDGTFTPRGNADYSHGGSVELLASSNITLGSVVTDGDCSLGVCTGDLTIAGRNISANTDIYIPDTVSVLQAAGATLSIAGNAIFDVGTGGISGDESDIKLNQDDNQFNGDISFVSAGNVELWDSKDIGITLGQSNVVGDITLVANGDISQSGRLAIGGTTSLSANNNAVNLNDADNDFVGLVSLLSITDLTIFDVNDLIVGNVDTRGNGSTSTGNITLNAGGLLTVGNINASGAVGNTSNRDGGNVTLTAVDDINAGSINTYGVNGINTGGSRHGGNGGDVVIETALGSIFSAGVITNGGDGYQPNGNNRDGGHAGDIYIRTQSASERIVLSDNLFAQGGLHGSNNHLDGAGGDINISGNVKLADDIQFHAGIKNGALDGQIRGNITIDGSVDSLDSVARDFTLTANHLIFRGNIGASNNLDDVVFNARGDIVAQSLDADPVFGNISAVSLNMAGSADVATSFHVGDITITADQPVDSVVILAEDIRVGAIRSSGGGIAISAVGQDAVIQLTDDINSQASDDSGHGSVAVTLQDAGSIFLNHDNFFTSTVNIIGSSGADILSGLDIDSTWSIVGENNGHISNGAVANITFINIENLIGGDGTDTFTFSGLNNSGSIQSIDGGGGDNTLIGRDIANTWSVELDNRSVTATGNVLPAYVTAFDNIDTLQGGNAVDIFNIDADFVGSLLGGDGDDQFNFLADGRVTIADGELGDDTLTGKNTENTWAVTAAVRSLRETEGISYVEDFRSMEILQGGDNVDIFEINAEFDGFLLGGDGADRFNLAANVVEGIEGQDGDDIFSIGASILANIHGNAGDDEFTLTATGITATIIGGTGVNNFIGSNNNNNFWVISGTNAGELVNGGTVTFDEISQLTGGSGHDTFQLNGGRVSIIDGGGGLNDTLLADNLINTWTLDSASSGTLATDNPGGYSLTFSNIESLTGNAQPDTFIFEIEEEYSGIIDAVGTDNIVSIAAGISADIAIVLGESIHGVQNADIVMGNGSGSITVQGAMNDTHTWEIGNPSGIVIEADGANDGEVSNENGDTIRFINVANLIGSDAVDNFILTAGASITGIIDGGLGANRLTSNTANTTWNLTDSRQGNLINASSATIASFRNIQTLVGSESDTLIGRNQANDWQITGADRGYVQIRNGSADRIDFSGMQNLTGGNNNDYFTFTSAGVISGNLSGANGDDTLIARHNTSNAWLIDGINQGSLTDEGYLPLPQTYANFDGIENLIGGNGADVFSFTNGGSVVDADGGEGIDSISFSSVDDIVVTLGEASVNGVRGIEQFIGNGATSTLRASNTTGTNTWTIFNFDPANLDLDGVDDGEVALADNSVIKFINFSNLEGGSGNDIFIFDTENSGSISGNISGGTGTSTLIARNTANHWSLMPLGNNIRVTDGEVYVNSFTNIQVIQGGSLVDTFTVGNAFAGSIRGGAGDDIFIINAATNSLLGEDGNDQFIFASENNAGSAISIDGGDGEDTLSGRHTANSWNLTDASNNLQVTSGANYVTNFTSIQTLRGGSAVDTFVIDSAFSGSIHGGAGNDIFTINAAVNSLLGEAGDDLFIFASENNVGSAVSIDGGVGENTLSGRHVASSWNLTDAGNNLHVTSGASYVAGFSNIQALQGGNAADIFNIGTYYAGRIGGGGNADIFHINAIASHLYGESGDDQFIFSSINNAGSAVVVDGGNGNDTLIGRNADTNWTLSDAGNTVSENGDTYVSAITAIDILQGGDAVDTFVIDAAYSGSVRGGAGNDIFTINATVNALLGEAGDNQFIFSSTNNAGSAAVIDGGLGNNILLSRHTANTWNLNTPGNSLRVTDGATYVDSFNNIQLLQGGDAVDTYRIDADFTGNIQAGAGEDIFHINATVNFLSGGAGNDRFMFDSLDNTGNVTSIDGGEGEDTLIARNTANTWNLTSAGNNLGSTDGASYVASFENIQILQGGDAVDSFLINAAFDGNVLGGDGNDRFTINAATNALFGESGDDQFIFSSANNAGSAVSIVGGTGENILAGRHTANTWSVMADGYSLGVTDNTNYVASFEEIKILQGGNAADTFEISLAFAGDLRGGSGNDIFNINATVNTVLGETGDDLFNFSSANNLGSAISIDGGDGEDLLHARHTANTWNLAVGGNNLGVTNGATYVASFANIQTLQGGNSVDRFAINNAFDGSLRGGAEDDVFTINAAVNSLFGEAGDDRFIFSSLNNTGRATSIDGGVGRNTVTGRNTENVWTLFGAHSGNISEAQTSTNYANLFTSIQILEGGTSDDTLIGHNQSNQWRVDGSNTGRVGATEADAITHIIFHSMENIVGGTGQDDFIFTTASSNITGLIDGGINGTASINDTLDISLLEHAITVELFDGDSNNLHVVNMEKIIAPVASAANNYLYGASDQAYIWTIDGANSGTVASAENTTSETTTRFINFGQLRGGENNDRFEVVTGGAIEGSIHGGDGNGIDFADYSNTNAHVTIALGGDGSVGATGINGIEGVIGNNSGTGITTFNSVIGIDSGNNLWTIGSFDGITDGTNDGQVSITLSDGSIKTISFENFNILNGGSGDDEFNLSNNHNQNGIILGYVNGGGGNNTFNAGISNNNPVASTANQIFHIKSNALDLRNLDTVTAATNVTQLFGFNTVKANENTNSILVSADSANIWNINADGTNSVSLTSGDIAFSGFSMLSGGSAEDIFNLRTLDGPLRLIDGGFGDAVIDRVDLSGLNVNNAVRVGVGNTATADINILNIEKIDAHQNIENELVSDAAENVWTISEKNTGTLNSSLGFSNFANLTGEEGNDLFRFTGLYAELNGVIDGGAGEGVDQLDLVDLNRMVTLRLSDTAIINSEFNAVNLEVIRANNDLANTLIADSSNNTWSIDGLNSGALISSKTDVQFIGFHNLVGGTGNDQFIFEATGVLKGYIDGAGQSATGEDVADFSKLSIVDILLSNQGVGYRGLERVIGNNQSSILRSSDSNTWNLLGENSGNINGNIIFQSFSTLVGGAGNDRFNLTQGALSGSVYGLQGNDTFVVSDAVISGSIDGGEGNDRLETTIASGVIGQLNFIGGEGNNSLGVIGGGSGYTAQHSFYAALDGRLRYSDVSNNVYNLTYAGVNNIADNLTATSLTINGTTGVDTVSLSNRAYTLNETTNVTYTNKNNLAIADAVERVVIAGSVNIPQLLTIQDAQVSSLPGGSIAASGLRLDGTAAVGSVTDRLRVNIADLFVRSTNGAVYLQEQNALNIAEFSSTALIDLLLDGDLTTSVALSSSQGFNAVTTDGNLILDKENALSGQLNLSAANEVTLRNLTATNLENINARRLSVNSTGVINSSGLIQVNGQASFASGGNINLANRAHNFNSLYVGSAGNLSVSNVDVLTLTGVSASGGVNISSQGLNVNGMINASNLSLHANEGAASVVSNITVNNLARITAQGIALDGDLSAATIELDGGQGQVRLNGELNTVGRQSISVAGNQIVQDGFINSGSDVVIHAARDLTQNANISAAGNVSAASGANLSMNAGHSTQGVFVEYTADGTMTLEDIVASSGLHIHSRGSIDQNGNLTASSGDVTIDGGRFTMNSGAQLSASAGGVSVNASSDIALRGINAQDDISLVAGGNVQVNEQIASRNKTITIQGGNIILANHLHGFAGIDIHSDVGNLLQQGQLHSEQGDIVLAMAGDITMGANSASQTTAGNINYRGANIAIASLNAEVGSVTISAMQGAVTDVNDDNVNVVAQRLVVDAEAGIGANDIIETLVSELSVSNNAGDIRLQNSREVTVDRLRSNGNIVFNNSTGSVILDNTHGDLFSLIEGDARAAGGTMNANYNIGTLTINVSAGDLTAKNFPNVKNPDIVARNAVLIAPLGNIGSPGRPLVIYVKDSLFIGGLRSWEPFWGFDVSPVKVENTSNIQGNLSDLLASGNEQLVAVETLGEVDPAIFTSVRNYFYDDISIMLPRDQLYYGDEYDE